jgi:hypothetical protein
VPELLEVEVLRILGSLHAERGVAARAAAAGHVVLLLHVLPQGEERGERVVCAIDDVLRDAVAADAGEAPLPVSGAEFGHERGAVGLEAADVEGRDVGLAHGWGSLEGGGSLQPPR